MTKEKKNYYAYLRVIVSYLKWQRLEDISYSPHGRNATISPDLTKGYFDGVFFQDGGGRLNIWYFSWQWQLRNMMQTRIAKLWRKWHQRRRRHSPADYEKGLQKQRVFECTSIFITPCKETIAIFQKESILDVKKETARELMSLLDAKATEISKSQHIIISELSSSTRKEIRTESEQKVPVSGHSSFGINQVNRLFPGLMSRENSGEIHGRRQNNRLKPIPRWQQLLNNNKPEKNREGKRIVTSLQKPVWACKSDRTEARESGTTQEGFQVWIWYVV